VVDRLVNPVNWLTDHYNFIGSIKFDQFELCLGETFWRYIYVLVSKLKVLNPFILFFFQVIFKFFPYPL